MSCYLYPNDSSRVFSEKLEVFNHSLHGMNEGLVAAGDFNARVLEWGMPRPNFRCNQLMGMASKLGLVVLITGTTPTYRRPGLDESISDVTFVSEVLFTEPRTGR